MKYIKYHDYYVYEDGRIYSELTNKFLRGDIVKGYLQYTLTVNKKPHRIKAHRLVGKLFLDDSEYNIINHKDGNKLNNHYSNLEWCTYKHNNKHARDMKLNDISKSNKKRWNDDNFRRRVSSKISEHHKNNGTMKHKKNPMFRYIITDGTREYTRQELSELTKLALSTTDGWIKKCANGEKYNKFELLNIKIIDTKNKSQQTIERVS